MSKMYMLNPRLRHYYSSMFTLNNLLKSGMLYLSENEKNIVIDKAIELLKSLGVDVREGL